LVAERYKRHQQSTGLAMKQQTLAMAQDQGCEQYRKSTRRDVFLETVDRIVPWEVLCAAIEPFYPKPGNGWPPSEIRMPIMLIAFRKSAACPA
jgi:IS5 family transposase